MSSSTSQHDRLEYVSVVVVVVTGLAFLFVLTVFVVLNALLYLGKYW